MTMKFYCLFQFCHIIAILYLLYVCHKKVFFFLHITLLIQFFMLVQKRSEEEASSLLVNLQGVSSEISRIPTCISLHKEPVVIFLQVKFNASIYFCQPYL